MIKKLGKRGRRLAWMSMDLLVKFKINKEIYAMWKKGQAT